MSQRRILIDAFRNANEVFEKLQSLAPSQAQRRAMQFFTRHWEQRYTAQELLVRREKKPALQFLSCCSPGRSDAVVETGKNGGLVDTTGISSDDDRSPGTVT